MQRGYLIVVTQVVSNMLDFKMDPQSALDAPRFCVADVDSSLGPICVEKSRFRS